MMNRERFLASTQAEWHRFVDTGEVDDSLVRPEVAQSWQRCRVLGIDPRAPKLPVMLDARRLAAVREDNRVLMETALPFMRFLKTAVQGTGFILVLTERSGVVLDVFGDEHILAMARENNYVPGCSRAEEVAGTNAISLALIQKRPIQLTGAEHWNVRHHLWTCASAPVFSPEGMLLGTVTLSGETIHAHRHTLGMVISAAEAIHERLRERETAEEKHGIDVMLASVLGSVSEAIITIDAAGIVTNINPAACKALAVEPGEAAGKPLPRLFPAHPELAGLLPLERDCPTFEVTAERPAGRAHFVITPYVMLAGEAATGAILALRERREFLNEVRGLSGLNAVFNFEDIVGQSPALLRQIELARVAARQSTRILILGETGTGKELFAQSIHNCSQRRHGPFVALNCAAIPRELMEAEIFGYRGGAFTGARKGGQVGKLELADGGTLFLDEINQMPLDLQSKLLRALQEGVVTRLGDSKPIRVDVRVIAAANEDLYAKSQAGEFRQDLYYRLSVVELALPPLRERTEDIALIARHLLAKLGEKTGQRALALSPAAVELLRGYPWPGNVRELENILEMGAIMADGRTIETEHLAYRMRTAAPPPAARPLPPRERAQTMGAIELDMIRSAIEGCNGNVGEAARRLGLSRSTLYRRMQQHGIVKAVTAR
ncbi:sigma-54-dependent Fis family transcriptional regulator [Pseudothauera nasutitermitis]|uniref:Sigma-54-dependent Fis family transcriptional regulator n=2 Tax=Pseudothauera nasutitermitis TaxID=2565930 RepID=A0A4S4AP75_9RHOO|nr:sigma-54-dependent Fis family transcriptional regulator [Pseudothauera nasutitermitis]